MRFQRPFIACFFAAGLLGLSGCSTPAPGDRAWVLADGSRWIHMEEVPPNTAADELLPTQRLILQRRWSPTGKVLLEGLETLCGTDLQWADPENLDLRLSLGDADKLRVKDGETWEGITLHVLLHKDRIPFEVWSPDRQRCLVVIKKCESGDWNLYLRRAGEPLFNAAMSTGWDDPDVFGGYGEDQPPVYVRWTGARSAEIGVPGKQYKVTLRRQAGDVTVHWKFLRSFKVPTPTTAVAPRIPEPGHKASPVTARPTASPG